MYSKNNIQRFVRQYDQMCNQFDIIYDKLITSAKNGDRESVTKLRIPLRQLNTIIIKLQDVLNASVNVSNYDKENGDDICTICLRIDEILENYLKHAEGLTNEDGTNYYTDDGLVDEREVPVEDARRAAEAWGEGDTFLTDFLETCIKQRIQTYGCCSGHNEGDFSYVLFDASNPKVIDLAYFLIENGLGSEITLWKNEFIGQIVLCLDIPMEEKELVYFLAGRHIEEYSEKDRHEHSVIEKLIECIEGENIRNTNYFFENGTWEIGTIDGKEESYFPEDLERRLENLSKGQAKKTVIERIKEFCSNSRFGLKGISEVGQLLKREQDREPEKREDDIQK